MGSPRLAGRPFRTACDRCYRHKEKCARPSVHGACTRCARLDLPCSTVRPVRLPGRRPRRTQEHSDGANRLRTKDRQPLNVASWLDDLPDLCLEEKELLMCLLDEPKNLECYVVNPSFKAAEQRSLAAPLPAGLPVLKDAYLACARVLKSYKLHDAGSVTGVDGWINLRHASSAIQTLRSLPVSSPEEAALCLTLGMSLAFFVYSTIGNGVAEISDYCLNKARPFIDAEQLDTDAEQWLHYLIMMETMDCLAHRKKPSMRIRVRDPKMIDRHLGLATSLLPCYYDLCVISHSLTSITDSSYMALAQEQLDRIHATVEAWRPTPPEHLLQQYDSVEVIHLLAQAKVYRLAALLISHRLRYAFGQHDSQADIWSKEIMLELDLVQRTTSRSSSCVTMPFIVAALEVQDPAARITALHDVHEYVDKFTPLVQNATKVFLSRVWRHRDTHSEYSWFDSTVKPCVVLHSIDRSLFG